MDNNTTTRTTPADITVDETGYAWVYETEEDAANGIASQLHFGTPEYAMEELGHIYGVRTWVKTTTSDGAEWHAEYKTEAAR